MKIAFIQKSPFPQPGVMSLSAIAKSNGFETELFISDLEKRLTARIVKFIPDLVGITLYSGEHPWAVKLCSELEKFNIPVVLGGPHPTYYPEIIEKKPVHIICRGEGEGAFLDLALAIRTKGEIKNIPNLWVKQNRRIYRNPVRNLIENLDDLPEPDREIYYDKYPFLGKISVKQFLSGRGCPYRCTFCSNHLLKKIYKDKGRYLRRREPKKVIEEITKVKEKYGLSTVSFTDDVFTSDENWLEEFLPLYRQKIKKPFFCQLTANLVNQKLITDLKKSGCYGVGMGIESGNERIRTRVLNKFISNDQILKAGKIIKSGGLLLKTYNMLCLPGEGLKEAWETIDLNAKIKPDYTSCSFLQPFPKYEITQYAKRHGYLDKSYGIDDYSGSIYYLSPIKSAQKKQLDNLQTFFFFVVKYPIMSGLVKLLIRFPPNFTYRLLAKGFYGLYMSRVHRLKFSDIIRYATHINPFDV